MAKTAETLGCVMLLIMINFVIIPVISYYLFLYYTHRRNVIIRKRHYKIIIAFNLLLMISLIGDKTLFMVSIILTDNLKEVEKHILYKISDYVYFVVGPSVLISIAMISWMIYFHTTWTIITNPHNKWTHFIDPKYNDTHDESDLFANNWFIKNQETFGNTGWITKYIIIPISSLIYCIFFLSLLINTIIHYYLFITNMTIIALFVGIIYCHIPKTQIEIFKIKIQMDNLIRTGFSFLCFFVCYVVLKTSISKQQQPQFIVILSFQYIFTVHYFICSIFSTRWILIESDLIRSTSRTRKLTQYIVSNTLQNDDSYWSLSKILKNKLSFNVFMSHLLKEFSSENLLAIIECWEFKLMLQEKNLNRMNELELDERLNTFQLPNMNEMPQSVIVYNDDISIGEKVMLLIEKYIYCNKGHCKFEINVSSLCKNKLVNKAQEFNLKSDSISLQQLFDLFDDLIVELIQLLTDSHSRFIHTDDYKQLIQQHLC